MPSEINIDYGCSIVGDWIEYLDLRGSDRRIQKIA
jgi:hypothetical protein